MGKNGRVARPTGGHEQVLSDETAEIAKKTKERISKNFVSFVAGKKWRNVDILNQLSPLVGSATAVTRMLNGEINVPIELCVALHYAFGVDLNEFIAGSSKKPFTMSPEVQKMLFDLVDALRCENNK